jgi:Selenoprotein, putative
MRRVLQLVWATLREIFDENAYQRYLLRTESKQSCGSYRAFLSEREAAANRKFRCC